MRPNGSPKTLERRRRKAVALLKQGLSFHEVGRRIGCHASSVMRWSNAVAKSGSEGLKPRPAPGRPCRLTAKQKERLVRYLLKGATAQGYRTELWTTQRIADLVYKRFKVRYHRDHIGRLLHQLGWSHQKPERRAAERNEQLIADWKHTVWPAVKKTPAN